MNANEVIANRAIELHGGRARLERPGSSKRPRQQLAVDQRFLPDGHSRGRAAGDASASRCSFRRWAALREAFERKAKASFDAIVKIGRTHLQDATPLTLGQEFSGYAAQVGLAEWGARERVLGSARRARDRRNRRRHGAQHEARATPRRSCRRDRRFARGLPFSSAPNNFAQLRRQGRARDGVGCAAYGGCCAQQDRQRRALAGERTALRHRRDLGIPANEPGSSIMPGKVNPTSVRGWSRWSPCA